MHENPHGEENENNKSTNKRCFFRKRKQKNKSNQKKIQKNIKAFSSFQNRKRNVVNGSEHVYL